jgi:hypothetical protein
MKRIHNAKPQEGRASAASSKAASGEESYTVSTVQSLELLQGAGGIFKDRATRLKALCKWLSECRIKAAPDVADQAQVATDNRTIGALLQQELDKALDQTFTSAVVRADCLTSRMRKYS